LCRSTYAQESGRSGKRPCLKECFIPPSGEIAYGLLELYSHPFWLDDIPQQRINADQCAKILDEFNESAPDADLDSSVA
jgi:hypothetical protein